MIAILSSFAMADLNECQGVMHPSDIPCYVLLPVNTSITACNSLEVQFYNISDSLYNQTLDQYGPNSCNATFNMSGLGTTNFLYSTGDTGSIVVDGGRTMELLIYLGMVVSFLLLGFGWLMKDENITAISGILFFVVGVFITINGFSYLSNLLTIGVALVFWALGSYIFIRSGMESIAA